MPRIFLVALISLFAACSQPAGDDARPAVVNNEQVQDRGADKDNWWDSLPRPEWSAYDAGCFSVR